MVQSLRRRAARAVVLALAACGHPAAPPTIANTAPPRPADAAVIDARSECARYAELIEQVRKCAALDATMRDALVQKKVDNDASIAENGLDAMRRSDEEIEYDCGAAADEVMRVAHDVCSLGGD